MCCLTPTPHGQLTLPVSLFVMIKTIKTRKEMYMKKLIVTLMIISLAALTTGCSTYMYGYTMHEALDKYLLVDKDTESFGYKRLQYNLGYNSSLEKFIENQGLPNFIFEYENNEGRESIRLYYTDKNIVYVYESSSWLAGSLYLKEHRALTDYEKQTYSELLKNKS